MNKEIIELLEELYELLRKGLSLEKALDELQKKHGLTAERIGELVREYKNRRKKRKILKQEPHDDPGFVEALYDLQKTISSENSLGL